MAKQERTKSKVEDEVEYVENFQIQPSRRIQMDQAITN